ncbi:hypothetical protein PTKIN_Ptkin15bG0022700 [Pterospermum kingtungense]
MSITSYFLLIFFLCLSLHACSHAHRLGALDNKNKLEMKLHSSIKTNAFKKNMSVVEELRSIKEESMEGSHADDDVTDQKQEDAEVNHKAADDKERTSGAVQRNMSDIVSVSWRVPYGKHGEKHPGFNLDYSSP